jgi:hypothetical protein
MRDGESNVLDEFRRGNVDAFETLFRLHQRAVYGWIVQIVRNPAAAEDVTIEHMRGSSPPADLKGGRAPLPLTQRSIGFAAIGTKVRNSVTPFPT